MAISWKRWMAEVWRPWFEQRISQPLPEAPMSILSTRPDGLGFHYGFAPDDHRQINVRYEPDLRVGSGDSDLNVMQDFVLRAGDEVLSRCRAPGVWMVYVGGKKIGHASTKEGAEAWALAYMKRHPEPVEEETDD